MLKKLKRFSKSSFKFQFVISYQELTLDCFNDWIPSEVYVLLSRKRKKIFTEKHPFVADPLKPDRFTLMWMIPEDVFAKVTMFKEGRRNSFDDKEWTLSVIQNDFVLASSKLNLKDYASIESHHSTTTIYLKPQIDSITMAYLIITISCGLVIPGNSNEDSQSLASSLSSCNRDGEEEEDGADVAKLSDFVSFPTMGDSNISWFTNGMQEFNHFDDERENIGNCEIANMREVSIPSLKYDVQVMDRFMQSPGPAESLMEWCIRITEGYSSIEINNMTTSFRDGMAFCAIISHHRPDLINFDLLSSSNIKENNEIAFNAAEKLGIRSPLNSNDMLALKIPDKLSVLTFLHQLRQYFLHSMTMNSYYHMNNHNSPVEANVLKKGSPINALNQHFNKNYLSRSMSPPSSIASPNSGYERKNFLNPFDSDEEELDSRCSTYIEANNAPNYSIQDKSIYNDQRVVIETPNYISSKCKSADMLISKLPIATMESSLPNFANSSNNMDYISLQKYITNNINKSENGLHISQTYGMINDNKYIYPTNCLDYSYEDCYNVQGADIKQEVEAKLRSFTNESNLENKNCINGLDFTSLTSINGDDYKIQKGTDEIIELLGNLSELIDQEQIKSGKRNNENIIFNSNKTHTNYLKTSKMNNNSFAINIENYKQKVNSDNIDAKNLNILEHNTNLENFNSAQTSLNNDDLSDKVSLNGSESPNLLHKMMHLTFIDDEDNLHNDLLSSNNKKTYIISSVLNTSRDSLNNKEARDDNCNAGSNNGSNFANEKENGNSIETQGISLNDENIINIFSDKRTMLDDIVTSKEMIRKKGSKKMSKKISDIPQSSATDNETRMKELRERARKLIADAKAKNTVKKDIMHVINANGTVSRVEVNSNCRAKSPDGLNGKITTWCIEDFKQDTHEIENLPDNKEDQLVSRLEPFNSPSITYLTMEKEKLDAEQKLLNEKAADVEWRLRMLMKQKKNSQEEQQLLQEWFNLVNQKNTLVHKRARLEMLESEHDLERRFQILSCELHDLMTSAPKTDTQEEMMHAKEKMLLEELMQVVKERDDLVQNMDHEERSFEDEAVSETEIKQKLTTCNKATCRIQ